MKKILFILFLSCISVCIYAQETDSIKIKTDEIKKSLENIQKNFDTLRKCIDSIRREIDSIKPIVISFNHGSSIDKYSKNIDCLYYLRKQKPYFVYPMLNQAPREANKQQFLS